MPKTEIICTIGPSSQNETIIRKMAICGMDVARLNFSHGSHKYHQESINKIKNFNKKYHRNIKILQDLEGHRIRIGKIKDHKPIQLKKHQKIWLTTSDILGNEKLISIDYEGSVSDIKKEQEIFIDDGNICLKAIKHKNNKLLCEVLIGGELRERKGINIPNSSLKFHGLSEKDKIDLEFGIENKVEFIAQSFVRNKNDIILIKDYIKNRLPKCKLIAKIENREGIKNLEEILKVSDGIMIARGDLGISLPIYEVPIIQKQIIKKCNKYKKFVITATQMLESMVQNPSPTRAEVSDVANAILDGTNYVMLSAETAVGRYPAKTVHIMNKIIVFTEKSNLHF